MSELGDMVANVRIHLGEGTQRFYEDADLKHCIGEGFRYYSLKMIEEGEGYFMTTANLGFTAGSEVVSLASLSPAFLSCSRLSRRVSEGLRKLDESQNRYRDIINLGQGAGDSYLPTYRFRGINLILEPAPLETEAGSSTTGLVMEYNYIPTIPNSASIDTFEFDSSFPTIFEANVELWAAIAALESKDAMGGVSDIQTLRNRLAKLDEAFFDALQRSESPDFVEYSGLDYSNPFW